MKNLAVVAAGAFAALSSLSCDGSADEASLASPPSMTGTSLHAKRSGSLPVPKPIPGGDVLPPSPPGQPTIHQFLPGPAPFDGDWAEPNGMTDFVGTVAQVYMGGSATDNAGRTYLVEVDTRVYQGAFITTDGKLAEGAFCEI